jgi:hypothetical protein
VTQSEGRGIDYYPEVAFEYRYEGTTYTGDSVFPGSISSGYDSRSEARAVVDPYDRGETVTAYVDPDSPGEAFLRKDTSSGPLLLAGVGAVMFLLVLFKGRQRASADPEMGEQRVDGDELAELTTLGIDHDRLGTALKRLIVASFVSTWLSLMGVFALVLAIGTSDWGSPAQFDLFDPAGMVFLLAFLSVCALIGSLFAYGGWSAIECRRLRTTLQARRRGLVALLFAGSEDLNRYERRVRLTAVTFLVATFLLVVLLDVLGVIDLPI